MREILFRGKRVDNGEWIFGSIVHQTDYYGDKCDRWFILEGDFTNDYDIDRPIEIQKETVGQCTGLKDKNGKWIFEGDVVKLFDIAIGEIVCECGAFGISCRQQIDYDYLASEIASVTGCDNTPMFCRNDSFVSLWELYWNYNEESSKISVIEVIGNIHDNPELLEGGIT
jgi:uncharacterized phage protein (TIGR01671 family)